ncbi:hypothetical protein [Butyrivibrio sp. AE3003]|uniref:hypothetical protein n=1 Tax=Butyrivibrio sp. AE3003 TaxID=1496721 RepID=UPI000478EC90|nr:hypothetical protein [Butyrivibrio sp. AE3003]
MSVDKVTVTKRCITYVIAEAMVYLLIPFFIYVDKKYHLDILKWILFSYFIYTMFNIPLFLSMANEKIIVSDTGVMHVLPTKKIRSYRWRDVCKVYLDSCGRYTNARVVMKIYDGKKIKLPYYLTEYDLLKEYLVERGILGMYSDSPLYYYSNMENKSRYSFDRSSTTQFFDECKVDISEVIDKVKSKDYLLAADILNQKTDIGMDESFLYIRQMKAMI